MVLDTDSCLIGSIVQRVFFKIKNFIFPEFVKEPSPSKMVNGTKNGCQNMVNGTKFVLQNWLMHKKCLSKLVSGTKNVFHFWLTVKMVTNQK